jgi:predicted MFS family arabinose efflux permease
MGVRSRPREIAPTDLKLLEQIRHGAITAWRTAGTRSPIVLVAVVAFTLSPFIAFVPTMAIEIFHAGATGTSWLVTAQGVGAVIAAIGMPSVARRTSRLAVIEGSIAVMIIATAGYALAPSLPLSVMAMMILGGAYIGALTGLNSTVQLLAPAAERSRILSLYTMSLSLAYPLGAFLQSFVVKGWGLRETTASSAVVMGVVVVFLRWRRPQFFRVMAATEK